jgi:tetratricopeptide (TPR) repeat protein
VRAQCLLKTGQKDKAEADLRALVQERQLRGKEFYAEGCLALAGREKDSGKSLQAAATASLGVFSPLANRYYLDCLKLAADAFVTAGKPADAAAFYAKAQAEVVALTDGTAAQRKALIGQCSLGYADMLFLSGDRKRALSLYLKAAANVSKASEKSWAIFQSAELLLRDGRTKEAKLLYSRLSKAYPGTYWEKQAQWRLQTMKQKKAAPAAEVK